MKATYTLTIEATGPHHQGHTTGNLDHDADHQLKSLVQKLQASGHIVHLATFQIQDGPPEFIAGGAADIKKASEAESNQEPILESILGEIREHRSEFKKFVAYEKKDDKAPKESKPPRGKKEDAPQSPKVGEMPEGTTGQAPPQTAPDSTTGDAPQTEGTNSASAPTSEES